MKSKSLTLGLVLTALCCLAALPAAGQNLVINGSFENPAIIPLGNDANLESLIGWTTSYAGGVNLGGNAVYSGPPLIGFNALDGNQFVLFNGGGTPAIASLSQTISTTVGEIYELSFYVGHIGSGGGNMAVEAELADSLGNIFSTITGTATLLGEQWNSTPTTLSFTAPTSNVTLHLVDASTGDISASDVVLDEVSITPTSVPEPCTAFFGIALCGLSVLRRRRNA